MAKNTYTLTKKGDQYCTVNKTTGKEVACFADRPKAMANLKALYAKQGDAVGKDPKPSKPSKSTFPSAGNSRTAMASLESRLIPCPDECGREFLTEQAMFDHADNVHTFDDIRQIVGEAIRDKYGKPYTALSPSTYAWVTDLTTDWVVFTIDDGTDCDLYRATYTLNADGTEATLGTPQEVVRRTVYDDVPPDNEDGDL